MQIAAPGPSRTVAGVLALASVDPKLGAARAVVDHERPAGLGRLRRDPAQTGRNRPASAQNHEEEGEKPRAQARRRRASWKMPRSAKARHRPNIPLSWRAPTTEPQPTP